MYSEPTPSRGVITESGERSLLATTRFDESYFVLIDVPSAGDRSLVLDLVLAGALVGHREGYSLLEGAYSA